MLPPNGKLPLYIAPASRLRLATAVVLALCCLLEWTALARAEVLAISDLSRPVSLSRQLLVTDDPARTLRYEDMLALSTPNLSSRNLPDPRHLQRNDDDILFRADTARRYWFRTDVQLSGAAATQQPLLVFPVFESQIYQLNLWITDSQGNTRTVEAGYLRPYSPEHSQHGYYAFDLPATPGPVTIVGYADHQHLGLPISLPVSIMSSAQVTQLQQHKVGVMTAFYSVMAMILLYNLFLWASIRRSLYGRYVVFLILGTGVSSMLDGSFQRWFFIDSASADLVAGYFLLSELMPILGGLIFLLQVHGVIPMGQWLLWSSHAGFVVESLLLSLAVAAQTKMAYQEKEREQLQNRAKTQFFATMSHEFRTPLTAVLGYTELALAADISPEKRLDYLRTIATSADYMLHLINDTLDMSKIEAQKMDFEKSGFELQAFCEEIHDYASILASKKHLRFHIHYAFPLPAQLVSDRTRLKQVLINLCSNAIKFTDSGSVHIRISADHAAGQIHFAVSDTGIGIKPDHIAKLFGVFEQTHDAAMHNVTGSGLGLYLSRLIAQNLGGDIAVTSEFGKGSTFTASVAIGHSDQDRWVTAFSSAPATTTGSGVHGELQPSSDLLVLIVDDNSVNVKLLSAMVTRWGARVITAADGLAAIASVIQHRPGLLLMDIDMPAMDGLTAMRHIRNLGLAIPAYAITGSVTDDMIQHCHAHGFDGHLAKPFQRHLIEAIVRGQMVSGK